MCHYNCLDNWPEKMNFDKENNSSKSLTFLDQYDIFNLDTSLISCKTSMKLINLIV